jgi:hypothetical protein
MIRFYKRRRKAIALFFVTLMLTQVLSVPVAHALTGGPSQPEVQSFKPAGVTEMVDLFTGDFSYNIPLFELPGPNGGYPFNLSYQSGIGMDQEASWVGLGWSMQPGAITRQMRGLPDEFKGDLVSTKMSIDPSITVGLGMGGNMELFGGTLEVGMGLSVYSNNYKGMGYKIDGMVGVSASTSGGMTGSLNVGFSLDSKEGVGVNPSLSLGGEIGQFGVGAGYNSKQGLTTVSLSGDLGDHREGESYEAHRAEEIESGSESSSGSGLLRKLGGSANLYLAHPSYTPQITMPMNNLSLSLTLSVGFSWWGIYVEGYNSGFYTRQKLDDDKKNLSTKGYGYLNYQHAGVADLLDYNREKDGMVSKETPNLAIPAMTYDIYNVTGQGIGMMYRPIRNDHGVIYDQETSSVSNSIGLGVDIGPAATHVGVNLNVAHSKSVSGLWTHNNDMLNRAVFNSKQKNYLYEPWYYKTHGERTSENVKSLDSLGGTDPVRVMLTGSSIDPDVSTLLEGPKLPPTQAPRTSALTQIRKPRTHSVEAFTNAEILKNASDSTMMPEYNVAYKQYGSETLHLYNRSDASTLHHFAGYTALNGDGLRYVYALPAYNLKQEEVTFSSERQSGQSRAQADPGSSPDEPYFELSYTDKFFKRTALPKFPHSYLLTSVLGPDYVDVTNDGVTADDLGYWVKFTYTRTSSESSPYKWRDPYTMAHFQEGWKSDPRDDKGSYTYGEKEIWYLTRAETKSHIAEFQLVERQDAKGVTKKLQKSTDSKGASMYALSSIKLYARTGDPQSPIKLVRFEHDYSLCPGVENGTNGSGKLTLKKLWFEYGGSTRGSLNPYEFVYNNGTSGTAISYDINAYDRWGNYKPHPQNDPLFNNDFPYTQQDPLQKAAIDSYAAAWSMKEIKLPSGGTIEVTYEADDYAYVQDKTATQMVEIVDPTSPINQPLPATYSVDNTDYQVRFKLEQKLPSTFPAAQFRSEVMKYLDLQKGQLFCKLLVDLRKPGEGYKEYVKGYVDIDFSREMILQKPHPDSSYVYGSFYVKPDKGKNPFAMRAWTHLRVNQPDLTNSGKRQQAATSNEEMVDQIKSLSSAWTNVRQMFDGFWNYCDNVGWGETITVGKSWIRLSSPDKIKYGGGLRVKQITMKDQWKGDGNVEEGEQEGVYGQIYEYTTRETINGPLISSGVASYEPIVGGEENAVRHAKPYVQSAPLIADNNLFFEYPINESYYPSPVIGYSKVTVMSLPSAVLAGKALANAQTVFPSGAGVSFGTSGKTVQEFYTAKDFPVITDETEKGNIQYKLNVPIPLIGNLSIMKLSSNQGYSVITNDMHGKQKKVSTYRQTKEGAFEPNAMSYVEYHYVSDTLNVAGRDVGVLPNVFIDNNDGTLSLGDVGEKYYLGQESEMFHDMRSFVDQTWGGGIKTNLDIVYIPIVVGVVPIPIFTLWPSISSSTQQLNTAVTNKVIFRSGILERTTAYDGQSMVTTTNLKWDKYTGQPVLTTVTNNFDGLVYNYTRPAFLEYEGMGGAYQNIGLTFAMSAVTQDPYREDLYGFNPSVNEALLRAGDELLLYSESSEFERPIARVIYNGKNENGDHIIYSPEPLSADDYNCMIIRSGYRNQLTVAAGTIIALTDPSQKGADVTYSKTIAIPNNE